MPTGRLKSQLNLDCGGLALVDNLLIKMTNETTYCSKFRASFFQRGLSMRKLATHKKTELHEKNDHLYLTKPLCGCTEAQRCFELNANTANVTCSQ